MRYVLDLMFVLLVSLAVGFGYYVALLLVGCGWK